MLSAGDLAELAAYDMQLERNTPLFYYMLKEAALVPDTDIGKNTGGLHLGPVGGRVVAEVVIGLLQADPASYLVQQPGWMPTLQTPGTAFPHGRFPHVRWRGSGDTSREEADLAWNAAPLRKMGANSKRVALRCCSRLWQRLCI